VSPGPTSVRALLPSPSILTTPATMIRSLHLTIRSWAALTLLALAAARPASAQFGGLSDP
jgi:hypothetical protein